MTTNRVTIVQAYSWPERKQQVMSEVHKCPTTPYFTNTMKSSIFQSQCWKMKIRFWKIQNFVEKKLGDFFLRCKWPNMALGGKYYKKYPKLLYEKAPCHHLSYPKIRNVGEISKLWKDIASSDVRPPLWPSHLWDQSLKASNWQEMRWQPFNTLALVNTEIYLPCIV